MMSKSLTWANQNQCCIKLLVKMNLLDFCLTEMQYCPSALKYICSPLWNHFDGPDENHSLLGTLPLQQWPVMPIENGYLCLFATLFQQKLSLITVYLSKNPDLFYQTFLTYMYMYLILNRSITGQQHNLLLLQSREHCSEQIGSTLIWQVDRVIPPLNVNIDHKIINF